jgi:hypothetical protein
MHATRIANLKRPLRNSRIDEEFLANVRPEQETSRTEGAAGMPPEGLSFTSFACCDDDGRVGSRRRMMHHA